MKVQRMDMTDCSDTNIHEEMINGWPLTDQNHFCNQDDVFNFTTYYERDPNNFYGGESKLWDWGGGTGGANNDL